MTFRIDSIKRVERTDGTLVWNLSVKGFGGQEVYFTASTGVNGEGLYSDRSPESPSDRSITTSNFELLSAERFSVPPKCRTEHVVHRVAAALALIGWGPEVHDDRDAISGGSAAVSTRLAQQR